MASGTSNRAWQKYLDADILQIVIAESRTDNVAHFQRKIQLSGFSAYLNMSAYVPINPDKWSSTVVYNISINFIQVF